MTADSGLRPFLKYVRPHAAGFVAALVASLGAALLSLAYPLLLKRLLDSWSEGVASVVFWPIVGVFAAAAIAQTVTTIAGQFAFVRATQRALASMRLDMLDKVMSKPTNFFSAEQEGSVLSVFMNDVNTVNGMLTGGLLSVLTSLLTLFAVLGVLFYLDWAVTLMLAAFMCMFVLVQLWFGPRLRRLSRAYHERLAGVTEMLHEAYAGIRVIKTFNHEDGYLNRFDRCLGAAVSAFERLNLNGLVMTESSGLAGSLGLVCALAFMGMALSRGTISVGSTVAYLSLSSSAFAPLRGVIGFSVQYRTALGAAERISELMNSAQSRLIPEESRIRTLTTTADAPILQFESASFSYGDIRVLDEVSFSLSRGERLLLTGPSGAGKSTLIDLVLGFVRPAKGEIRFMGVPVSEADSAWLRSRISLVQQDPFLFNDSLRSNLAIAAPEAGEAAMLSAIAKVGLGPLVDRLPRGLDSEVGERGAMLSGGEKQRIAIARALLRDGDLVVLDEATAWLDSETEQGMWDELAAWLDHKAVILVSHRDSTSFGAGRHLSLRSGRLETIVSVVAQG